MSEALKEQVRGSFLKFTLKLTFYTRPLNHQQSQRKECIVAMFKTLLEFRSKNLMPVFWVVTVYQFILGGWCYWGISFKK